MNAITGRRTAQRFLAAWLGLAVGAGAANAQVPAGGPPPSSAWPPASAGPVEAVPATGAPDYGPAAPDATPAPESAADAVPAEVGLPGRPRGCTTCGRSADVPPPLGSHVHAVMGRQADLALENLFGIGLWEWVPGTPQLTVGGLRRLAWIVWRLDGCYYPIKVQPGPDDALNEARKAQVIALLEQQGLTDAATRVVIAPSAGEGLRYDEIEYVGHRVLIGAGTCGGYGNGPVVPFGGAGGAPVQGILRPY